MVKRMVGSAVFISAALAVGSTSAGATYCLEPLGHSAPQIAGHGNAADGVVHERSGGLPTAPTHQTSAAGIRTAQVVADSRRASPVAPPTPLSPGANDASSVPSNGPLAYSILDKKDDRLLSGVRVVLRIQLSRPASESELLNIGEEIICQETASRRLNAIQLLYYLTDADISGLALAGTALWAPSGHWDAAHTVRLGDYSRHQHVVSGGYSEGARECGMVPEHPRTTP